MIGPSQSRAVSAVDPANVAGYENRKEDGNGDGAKEFAKYKMLRMEIRDQLPRIAAAGMQPTRGGLPSRVKLQDEQRTMIAQIETVLDAQDAEQTPFGDAQLVLRLVDYIVRRENELMDAVRQINERDEHLRVADMKMEKLLHDNEVLTSQLDRLSATQEELSKRLSETHEQLAQEKVKRIPPDPGRLYAREDHLRVMEELEDVKAQLDHWKGIVSRMEEEVSLREEQLVIATENLTAVQGDRTRIQKDMVELATKLGAAETRVLQAQKEATETEESMRAEVEHAQLELNELQTRFDHEVGHMVEKEARMQIDQQELVLAQNQLKAQSASREEASMNQMGDATVKIEYQEHELKALRTRVKELELLLVEQQDTLDRLIADAMSEVAKRETEWLAVRNRKDARIEILEDELRRVRMEESKQHQRADEYERQFRSMEDDYRERIAELQARFDRMQQDLTRDIEMQKRDFKTQFEVATRRTKELTVRDSLQQKQITELLQQKAWLQRQMGLPEIIA